MNKRLKIVLVFSFFIILGLVFNYYKVTLEKNEIEQARIKRSEIYFNEYLEGIKIRENSLNYVLFREKLKIKNAKDKEIKKYIENNSMYIKNKNTEVFGDDFKLIDFNFKRTEAVIVVDKKVFKGDEYFLLKIDYYKDVIGWVKSTDLTKNMEDFIEIPYNNVDYTHFKKTNGYEGNPRIKARGIYVTGHTAATNIDKLIELSKRTEINSFVIDFKDDNENMLFYSKAAEENCPRANKRVYIKNPMEFMKKLKDNNIYLIARIVTFKSPRYAIEHPEKSITYKNSGSIFKTGDGISWSSPYDRDLWKYNVSIAKEAAALGFNEIQFDYVRFPATGRKKDLNLNFKNHNNENKTEAIQNFLKYAYEELSKEKVYVAADIFGWAATAISDVGIGQHWEAIANVVDYTCPMMYPSHYGPGIYGLAVPDAQPYVTIDRSIKDAIMRNNNINEPAKLRPWIQDFTASWVSGHIRYGALEVSAQINALKDNGVDEYILWNPLNRYSEGALQGGKNE